LSTAVSLAGDTRWLLLFVLLLLGCRLLPAAPELLCRDTPANSAPPCLPPSVVVVLLLLLLLLLLLVLAPRGRLLLLPC
jgi:hypothetical protein